MNNIIAALIQQYAKVYQDFETLQKGEYAPLSKGDQKTGVIAEYYAKCYIESQLGIVANYAKSGKSYDLEYGNSGKKTRIQVKGVSAHSTSRTIAPLSLLDKDGEPSFDELYLIDMDKCFIPIAFYINKYETIKNKVDKNKIRITGTKMQIINKPKSGSAVYDFNENKINDLLVALNE